MRLISITFIKKKGPSSLPNPPPHLALSMVLRSSRLRLLLLKSFLCERSSKFSRNINILSAIRGSGSLRPSGSNLGVFDSTRVRVTISRISLYISGAIAVSVIVMFAWRTRVWTAGDIQSQCFPPLSRHRGGKSLGCSSTGREKTLATKSKVTTWDLPNRR